MKSEREERDACEGKVSYHCESLGIIFVELFVHRSVNISQLAKYNLGNQSKFKVLGNFAVKIC